MDERSIVTPSDLDAAIRAQQSRRWDALWAESHHTGLSKRDWVVLAFAGLMVALNLNVLMIDPDARNQILDALPQCLLFFHAAMLVFCVYVSHTSRQVKALRKLLHGVLAETALLPSRGHLEFS